MRSTNCILSWRWTFTLLCYVRDETGTVRYYMHMRNVSIFCNMINRMKRMTVSSFSYQCRYDLFVLVSLCGVTRVISIRSISFYSIWLSPSFTSAPLQWVFLCVCTSMVSLKACARYWIRALSVFVRFCCCLFVVVVLWNFFNRTSTERICIVHIVHIVDDCPTNK